MNLDLARRITGGLSKTFKMPCSSYNLSAFHCLVGSFLQKVKGSVCHGCYAMKGNYRFPNVKTKLKTKRRKVKNKRWTEGMIALIENEGNRFFRWHDSGDLQGAAHFEKIVEVARNMPRIKFWLPTRESGIVNSYVKMGGTIPSNLVVRLSGMMVGGAPPRTLAHRLGVLVSSVDKENYDCPSTDQGNKCLDCRKCWDKRVFNITYKKH